ncbi:hypothetical protein EI94DRAFT_1739872 [Lactarius quietus]|nr:hypothetical protein EI94DRAFT_1739872 [Lactarius quietus]
MGRLYSIFPFCVMQLRRVSRMCVSGLVLDPEVPIYAMFTKPFSSDHSIRATPNTPVVHSAVGSTHPPSNLNRKVILLHRLVVSMETQPDRSRSLAPDMTSPRP